MLLIGDLHVTSRYADKIIAQLKAFVDRFPEEKSIIFLGDYVYHFSYDRTALLALYDFFVGLFASGKNVYVLAGNHDRLGQNFVYEEAQKAFGILTEVDNPPYTGSLRFITKLQQVEIEGQKILFLPYMLDVDDVVLGDGTAGRELSLLSQIKNIEESSSKQERHAAKVNASLLKHIQGTEKLTVIHHYYINKEQFPGQKARFYFKDGSLSEYFLNCPSIKMISGHLHQGFSYKNYLCLGSVWSTSSLENNQIKTLARWNTQKDNMELYPISINPYLLIEGQKSTADLFAAATSEIEKLDHQKLKEHRASITKNFQQNFQDKSSRNCELQEADTPKRSDVTINLKVPDLDYDKLDQYISPELRSQLKDVKLKKSNLQVNEVLDAFDEATKRVSDSFADRKNLLKSYLLQKFKDEAPKYEEILRREKLI